MKQQFLSLKPSKNQKYSVFSLYAYNDLCPAGDSHGEHIWLDDLGRVWVDRGIVVNNTYHGERSKPEQV
jgi:hypothetical protein